MNITFEQAWNYGGPLMWVLAGLSVIAGEMAQLDFTLDGVKYCYRAQPSAEFETYDMSGWTYDYSTRTYNITYNEGDTVNITYGDENITIVEPATVPNYPSGPNKTKIVLTATAVGVVLAAGIVLLLEFMDNTIQSSDDIEKHLGIPVLAQINKLDEGGESK